MTISWPDFLRAPRTVLRGRGSVGNVCLKCGSEKSLCMCSHSSVTRVLDQTYTFVGIFDNGLVSIMPEDKMPEGLEQSNSFFKMVVTESEANIIYGFLESGDWKKAGNLVLNHISRPPHINRKRYECTECTNIVYFESKKCILCGGIVNIKNEVKEHGNVAKRNSKSYHGKSKSFV